MCKYFIGKHNMQAKVATEDMAVFKVVKLDLQNQRWRAIYQSSFSAPLNTEISAQGTYPERKLDNFLVIGAGMFHSCADLNTIKMRNDYEPGTYVVKCIIPKGTTYYASKVPNDLCSEKLIVTDVIIAGNGYTKPEISDKMLKNAEVSTYHKDNRTYIHIKDEDHEVYLSLKNLDRCDWYDAIKKCKEFGGVLPNTDDWDLVNKYRHQIDPMLKELHGDSLDSYFWSLSEYDYYYVWSYSGGIGRFFYDFESDSYACRPVLALGSLDLNP